MLRDLSILDLVIERGPPAPLQRGLQQLFAEAEHTWTENEQDFHFRDFVSADYTKVYQALVLLKDQADTFLEWGSGLGAIASAAGQLGYSAYGIEVDAELLCHARRLAETYDTNVQFAYGSFVPNGYEWSAEFEDEFFKTVLGVPDGYDDLDMELRDFDLVYGYPWPGERPFFIDIMRRFGRAGAMLMTYDIREGVLVERI